MPYKLKEDKTGNNRLWKRVRKLELYRSMGLEPLDINDYNSDLECVFCGKTTSRRSARKFLHYEGCLYEVTSN